MYRCTDIALKVFSYRAASRAKQRPFSAPPPSHPVPGTAAHLVERGWRLWRCRRKRKKLATRLCHSVSCRLLHVCFSWLVRQAKQALSHTTHEYHPPLQTSVESHRVTNLHGRSYEEVEVVGGEGRGWGRSGEKAWDGVNLRTCRRCEQYNLVWFWIVCLMAMTSSYASPKCSIVVIHVACLVEVVGCCSCCSCCCVGVCVNNM